MSNYSNKEKDTLILLENALKNRNKEISDLKNKLERADRDFNALNIKVKRLEDEIKRLKDVYTHLNY